MDKVIILDDMAYVRYRIRNTIEEVGFEVYESANSFDFFNKLSDNKKDIVLIILEVGLVGEDGFDILKKIKAKEIDIPVMVLTKLNTREDFIRCIKEGTSEYILKPFNSKMLVERVGNIVKHYKKNHENGEIKYLNFQEYIIKQIERAKNENTEVSIVMSGLVKFGMDKSERKIDINDSYISFMDMIYENLKEIFIVPDLFAKYGLSTFIAVMPKCGKKEAGHRIKQMDHIYEELVKTDEKYLKYQLLNSAVVFPGDGSTKDELLDKLALKMKYNINS